MFIESGLGMSMGTMPMITNAKTRSISAENPNGEPGMGGKAASNLGVGRKGRPCIDLKQGEVTTLANITGTGSIQHFWITVTDSTDKGGFVLRDLILRMYWDGEETPSVEAPLGDFFCNGFAIRKNVNSLPVSVNTSGGFNCYIPMPFRKSALITIENQHEKEINGFFYQFNYTLVDNLPDNAGYFHAQWRRTKTTALGEDHVILDQVKGSGQYIGTYIAWAALERSWWGEGEVKFYMDGDTDYPTICGTGTEDYFGGAWCYFDPRTKAPGSYSTPYLGYHYYDEAAEIDGWYGHKVPMHGLYRWHVMDPVRFEKDLKVTVQAIGHNSRDLFERADDISSVAYWYQKEPSRIAPTFPSRDDRRPR
jgi:hypothetical protein